MPPGTTTHGDRSSRRASRRCRQLTERDTLASVHLLPPQALLPLASAFASTVAGAATAAAVRRARDQKTQTAAAPAAPTTTTSITATSFSAFACTHHKYPILWAHDHLKVGMNHFAGGRTAMPAQVKAFKA